MSPCQKNSKKFEAYIKIKIHVIANFHDVPIWFFFFTFLTTIEIVFYQWFLPLVRNRDNGEN